MPTAREGRSQQAPDWRTRDARAVLRRWRRRAVLSWTGFAVALYVLVAVAVYRFRHADLTETELFLRLHRAVLWLD